MREALRSWWSMFLVTWRHDRLKISIAAVLTVASGLVWPLVALALKAATDAVVAQNTRVAVVAGVLVAAGAIGVLVLHHFAFTAYVEVSERAAISLEADVMALANGSVGLSHHERPEYADKIAVLQQELSDLMEGVGGLLRTVAVTASLGVTGVLLVFVSPWLLLLPVAAVVPVMTGQWATRIVERGKEDGAEPARRSRHLFQMATSAESAKEVRASRLQSELRHRITVFWNEAERTLLHAEMRATVVGAAGQICFAAAYVCAVLLVIRQAVSGRSQVGDVVLIMALAAQVNQQISAGLQELRTFQRIAYGFTRLRWLRAVVEGNEPPPPDAVLPDRIRSGIELRGVRFHYPGTAAPVLTDADVLLPAGTTVAIVGENGAGKTTLVKLLCRFYDVSGGSITLDGVDIRRFPADQWRQRIAAGFQDFMRFEVPARHAVGIGDLPYIDDDPAVHGALQRAKASDVIAGLHDGLATHLGKSYTEGVELSGGQWQKLALGRAMMRTAPMLLVLDEPTSALDAATEHLLFQQYAEQARRVGRETGAITVLVSHRFSTVRMADVILVIAGGRITEAGSHEDLMAGNGLYAELYRLQARGFRDEADAVGFGRVRSDP